jgi:hypothetical protein
VNGSSPSALTACWGLARLKVARTRTSGNGVANLHPYQAAEIRLTNWALPYEPDFLRWKKLGTRSR